MRRLSAAASIATVGIFLFSACAPGAGSELKAPSSNALRSSGSAIPTSTPSNGGTPNGGTPNTASPTSPGARPSPSRSENDAKGLVQKGCVAFGATLEQKIDTKYPNQEKATSNAKQAAQLDAQWKPIADDMSLITSVGERINIQHDPTVTTDESNKAGQAITDLQGKCEAAGAGFPIPAD